VANQKRVDARHPRQRQRGMFLPRQMFRSADAGVRQHHHQIGARCAQVGHPCRRCLDDVARYDPPGEVAMVPGGDLRRCEAEHPDSDLARDAVAAYQLAPQHCACGQQQLVAERPRFAQPMRHVCRHHRKLRPAKGRLQKIDAVVEIVVAHGCRVITHRVHRRDDRVRLARAKPAFQSHKVAQRIALQHVAAVKQQSVGRLGAAVQDQPRRMRQAKFFGGLVGIIVVRKDMHMQICGLHKPQVRLGRPERCSVGPGRIHQLVLAQVRATLGAAAAIMANSFCGRLCLAGFTLPATARHP
jgi:hypothetical protein